MERAAAAAETHLVVDGVSKTYGQPTANEVLRGVSLAVGRGETVTVVGVSGSGKSTLLNIIGSLDRPTGGTVTVGGIRVDMLQGNELAAYRRRMVGFVFQDHHLLPQCTVIENVLLPTVAMGLKAGEARKRAESLLERVGLADRAESFPSTLSGGERQRVAIARAMVNEPPLLLCDEPTGNLDHATGESIAGLFVEMAQQRGAMLVVVTHNRELAARCKRCYELRDGRLEEAEA